MKKIFNHFLLITFALLIFIHISISAQRTIKNEGLNTVQSLTVSLDSTKICRWKYGARTCINFSFDDYYNSHTKISRIMDKYNFKATFYTNAFTMSVDSIIDMCNRGHEIGNHTFSHLYLPSLDSSTIEYQIHKGKQMIEDAIGKKCVSLAEPGNQFNDRTNEIALKFHLFFRNHSEYAEIKHRSFSCQPGNMSLLKGYIENSIEDGNILQVAAHSINGEGYMPLTEELFTQALDLITNYSKTGEVWVSTAQEGIGYENIYHETVLEKSQTGDTIFLNIRNYHFEKYRDVDSSQISIQLPKNNQRKPICSSKYADIIEFDNKYIVTFNLKRETSIYVVL